MKKILIGLTGVVLIAMGWFFVSPLFIDRTVDEGLDFILDSSGAVDMVAVMSMPDDKRMAMKQAIMDAASRAPDIAADETMPDSTPRVIAEGQFVDADAIHKGGGRAILYGLPDGRSLVRFEDFRVTNGPALVVYLAKHPSPAQASHVTDEGFISLGKLKGNVGNQNYRIPAEINVDEFNSVVIWCELFGVLFSPAALQRVET